MDSEENSVATQPALRPVVYSRDDHPISKSQIDPDAVNIMYRLHNAGFKAYLVGGGVRDLLLKKKPKDFDIATDARPNQIKNLFRNSRIIGRRFKLVHIFFPGGKNIEVSTFRDSGIADDGAEETEVDQITRDNTYGDEATDAFRRDITINAIYYDIGTLSIIDYVGGVQDLDDRIIRVIGKPDVRFKEDPVRMIRVARHSARAVFQVEPDCWDGIIRNKNLILQCPSVRVYEELRKDLSSGFFLNIARILNQCELLELLVPELAEDKGRALADGAPLARSLAAADARARNGMPPSPTVILSLIALHAGSPDVLQEDLMLRFDSRGELLAHIDTLFKKMSVPRKERERIERLLALWHSLHHNPTKPAKPSSRDGGDYREDIHALCAITGDLLRHPDMLDKMGFGSSISHEQTHNDRPARQGAPRGRGPTNRGRGGRGGGGSGRGPRRPSNRGPQGQ